MPRLADITGQRFEKLVALRRIGKKTYPAGHARSIWLFRCDCGAEVEKTLTDVRRADTKSCGCGRFGKPAANRLADGEASFNGLYTRYRNSARIRHLAFGITKEQFAQLTSGDCHYGGQRPSAEHLTHKSAFGAYQYNGLDRVDNEQGYVPSNLVSCCSLCNRAKAVMSQAEFIQWIGKAYLHNRKEGRLE